MKIAAKRSGTAAPAICEVFRRSRRAQAVADFGNGSSGQVGNIRLGLGRPPCFHAALSRARRKACMAVPKENKHLAPSGIRPHRERKPFRGLAGTYNDTLNGCQSFASLTRAS